MQVLIDNLITNYQITGNGRHILFLHGWADTLKTFDELTSQGFENYRVIRLDLPGFGGTDTPNVDYDLDKYASFVEEFLKKINLQNIYCVIGHSNGGAIAVKSLATNRIKSEKLVLLASSGVRSGYNGKSKSYRLSVKGVKQLTKILPKKQQDKLKKKAYKTIGSEMFVAENMQGTFKNIVSEDIVELSKDINQETLLIYGSEDELTPLEYGNKFNGSIEDSSIVTIEGARHMIQHTDTEQVRSEILGFIND